MIHHYITKYIENGKMYVEAWIQIDIFGQCICFSNRKIEVNRMGDLVSRQAAIDVVKKHYRTHDNDLLELIAFDIERLPPAQPEPRRGEES